MKGLGFRARTSGGSDVKGPSVRASQIIFSSSNFQSIRPELGMGRAGQGPSLHSKRPKQGVTVCRV